MASIDRYISDIDQTLLLIKNTKGIPEDVRKNINEMATQVKKKLNESRNVVKKEVSQIINGQFNMEESGTRKFEQAEQQYEKLMKEMREIISKANRSIIREVEVYEVDNYIYSSKANDRLLTEIKAHKKRLKELEDEMQLLRDKLKDIERKTAEGKTAEGKTAEGKTGPLGEEHDLYALPGSRRSSSSSADSSRRSSMPGLIFGPERQPTVPITASVVAPSEGLTPETLRVFTQVKQQFMLFLRQIRESEFTWANEIQIATNRINWQSQQIAHFTDMVRNKLRKLNDTIFIQSQKIEQLQTAHDQLVELHKFPKAEDKMIVEQYVQQLERQNRFITDEYNFIKEKRDEYLLLYTSSMTQIDKLEAELKYTKRLVPTKEEMDRRVMQKIEEKLASDKVTFITEKDIDDFSAAFDRLQTQRATIEKLARANERLKQTFGQAMELLNLVMKTDEKIDQQTVLIEKLAKMGISNFAGVVEQIRALRDKVQEQEEQLAQKDKLYTERLKQMDKSVKDRYAEMYADEFKKQIDEANAWLAREKEKIGTRFSKYERMENELKQLKEANEYLKTQKVKDDEQMKKLRNENSSLIDKMRLLEIQLSEMGDLVLKEQEKTRELRRRNIKQIGTSDQNDFNADRKEEKLLAEISRLKQQLSELQQLSRQVGPVMDTSGQQSQPPNRELEEKFEKLTEEFEKLKSKNEEYKLLSQINTEALKQKSQENAILASQIHQLSNEAKQSEVKTNFWIGKANSLIEEKRTLQAQLEELFTEYKDVLDRYTELMSHYQDVLAVTPAKDTEKSGGSNRPLPLVLLLKELDKEIRDNGEHKIAGDPSKTITSILGKHEIFTKFQLYNRDGSVDFKKLHEFQEWKCDVTMEFLPKLSLPEIPNGTKDVNLSKNIEELQRHCRGHISATLESLENLKKNKYTSPYINIKIHLYRLKILESYLDELLYVTKHLETLEPKSFWSLNNSRTKKTLERFNAICSKLRQMAQVVKQGGNPSQTGAVLVAVASIGSQAMIYTVFTTMLIFVIIFLIYIIYMSKTENYNPENQGYSIKYYPVNGEETN